jgi:hypothetical protein
MRYLIGIDDTDNLESRGTGFRARQLSARLDEAGIARTRGITRHQLFVHPDIPYTSHNSSACLDVDLVDGGTVTALQVFCRDYLAAESAPGSDAGLCVAPYDRVADALVEFGRSAKCTLLTRELAARAAAQHGLHLEGVTGDHMGMIGALSAVGLRRGGHDGRFIWLKGVRELTGTTTAGGLLETTGIDSVETIDGQPVPREARILVDPWPRPVLLSGKAVLLTQEYRGDDAEYEWELLPKETIRRY